MEVFIDKRKLVASISELWFKNIYINMIEQESTIYWMNEEMILTKER